MDCRDSALVPALSERSPDLRLDPGDHVARLVLSVTAAVHLWHHNRGSASAQRTPPRGLALLRHVRPGTLVPFRRLEPDSPSWTRRSQSQPSGALPSIRKALEAPADNGAHEHGLDVLAESAPNYLGWIADDDRAVPRPEGAGSRRRHRGGHRRATRRGARWWPVTAPTTCVAALRRRFQDAPNVTVLQGDLRELSDLEAALRVRRDAQRPGAHRG